MTNSPAALFLIFGNLLNNYAKKQWTFRLFIRKNVPEFHLLLINTGFRMTNKWKLCVVKFLKKILPACVKTMAINQGVIMSITTPRTIKIIEPPASLEYTEYTEPVAQALQFEAKVFLRVLCALQGAARVV